MNERRAFWAVATPAVAIILILRNGGITLPDFGSWDLGGTSTPASPPAAKPPGADECRWIVEPFAGQQGHARMYAGVFATLARYLDDDAATGQPLVTTAREFHAVLKRVIDAVPIPSPGDYSGIHARLAAAFDVGEGPELLSQDGRHDRLTTLLRALAWNLQNEVD